MLVRSRRGRGIKQLAINSFADKKRNGCHRRQANYHCENPHRICAVPVGVSETENVSQEENKGYDNADHRPGSNQDRDQL